MDNLLGKFHLHVRTRRFSSFWFTVSLLYGKSFCQSLRNGLNHKGSVLNTLDLDQALHTAWDKGYFDLLPLEGTIKADSVEGVHSLPHSMSHVFCRCSGQECLFGKTTILRMAVNHLLSTTDRSIYALPSWSEHDVRAAGGWQNYLQEVAGVNGHQWFGYNTYLFIDEAQSSVVM